MGVALNPKSQNIAFQATKYISINSLKKNTSIGERINKIRYVDTKLWDMDGLAAPENLTTLSIRSIGCRFGIPCTGHTRSCKNS